MAVHGLLTVVASPVAGHGPQHAGSNSRGSRAELPRAVWGLPGPRIKPVSLALAGRFLVKKNLNQGRLDLLDHQGSPGLVFLS